MKKSNRILIILFALVSFTTANGYAQIVMNDYHSSGFSEKDLYFSKSPNSFSASVNFKAEKNFSKAYAAASRAEWSTLKDHSLLCRFTMHDLLYRAFYTTKGKWMYTVSGYDGASLNKEVYNQVKRLYYNSDIVYADQIDQPDAKTIYLVEVRDEKSIKKIRVQGDEMEEIREFVK